MKIEKEILDWHEAKDSRFEIRSLLMIQEKILPKKRNAEAGLLSFGLLAEISHAFRLVR